MIKAKLTAAVLIVALLVLGSIVLFGPALGVAESTLRYILGGLGLAGLPLLAALRGLFHEDVPGE
jgi:hypothetical protein